MARDAGLEALVGEALQELAGVSTKAMFGGRAWLLDGHLLCGARHDGLLVRLGKHQDAWALALPDVEPMRSGDRVMPGWVRCGPSVFGEDALRERLLSQAIEFVRSLPPK